MYLLGFDIGGTKCAAVTAKWENDTVTLENKVRCDTDHSIPAEEMLARLMTLADGILEGRPDAIGISCGGPLDSAAGVILCPPNLPRFVNIPVADIMRAHYGVPVHLQNDANACAVAEWKFGAARGAKNAVFMTFGTGLGAGLILDGRLYAGTSDSAGELGHIRLDSFGPVGFGKAGSFEGFCSGGGIAQLGYIKAQEALGQGVRPAYFPEGATAADVTAKSVAIAAEGGDPTALEVYRISGEYLGKGLSVVIDLLNPEVVVIGSIFARSRDLLWDAAKKVIEKEALASSVACCRVVPAGLGEQIGDYAAVAAALL